MRRITDIISIAIALAGIASVYSFKEETRELHDQAQKLKNNITEENEEIKKLKAIWVDYNETQRVASLSEKHLNLKTPEINDYISFEDIPRRPMPLDIPENQNENDPISELVSRLLDDQNLSDAQQNQPVNNSQLPPMNVDVITPDYDVTNPSDDIIEQILQNNLQ